MRVLQIIDQLKVGGAERVFVDVTNMSYEYSIDVSVLCLLDKTELDAEIHTEIPVNYLNRKNKFNVFTLMKLYSFIKNYQIIHVHCRQVLRYVGLLYLVPFFKKPKLVFHDHYGKIDTDTNIDLLLSLILDKTNLYIGVSNSLIDWIQQKKIKLKNVLLSNIIRKNKTVERQVTTSKSKILMIGNFRQQKNYGFALNLLKALPSKYTLSIIGGMVENDYYHDFLARVDELQLNDRLFILANEKKASDRISEFDFAIHTAKSETGPLVALEYMQKNIPFLMFNTGEVANQIRNYIPDFIMTTFVVEDWISRLNTIEQNYSYYKNRVEEINNTLYSEKEYMVKLKQIYKQL